MRSETEPAWSRRQLVGLVSAPVLAATLVPAWLAGRSALAEEANPAAGPKSIDQTAGSPAAPPASDDKTAGSRIYNIRDFGAAGDGTTLDTAALQAAIDACHGNRGGTVLIPAGDFLIGTTELKSNVTLHLSPQGRLFGSGRHEDYSAGKGVPPGNGNVVLLYAANAENVTIEGRGTIDGQGANFYTGVGDGTGPGGNQGQPRNVERPHLLVFFNCKNLLLRDSFFTRSAYHCCRILRCQYVNIDGIHIYNRVNKNNDGFHFNDSQFANIANCNVVCQDDACALFGSNKFVAVTNCSFSTRWSVFRFGGGEAENITVSNCIIYDTYGCPIKMNCGPRSRFENMLFSNLVLKNVTGPISIDLGSRRRANDDGPAPAPGIVRNIAFNGLRGTVITQPLKHDDEAFDVNVYPGEVRTCIVVNGTGDNTIENVSFTDVQLKFAGGGTAEEAEREVPQIAGEYFEIGTPPAYGLYARNVHGLTLNGMRLETATPDLRPAVVLDHVQDVAIANLSAAGNPQSVSVLRFTDVQDALLTGMRLLTPAAALLQVEGQDSANIVVDGGQLSKADKPLILARGATNTAVKMRI